MPTSINHPLRPAVLAAAAGLALAAFTTPVRAADDAPAAGAADASPATAPKIDVTKPPAIQKYKLKRLTNAQAALVERKPEKPYKTVYEHLLTRKGLDRKVRQESADALAKIGDSSPVLVLIDGLGQVDPEDKGTSRELVSLLLTQKPDALAAQKEKLQTLAAEAEKPAVRQAAYAALATADGKADAVWELAAGKDGGTEALLGGVGLILDPKVRGSFYPKVAPLAAKADKPAVQVAAIDALAFIPGQEAEVFKMLAGHIAADKGELRDAAVRSLGRIPAAKLPKDQLEPLARQLIEVIKATPADKQTEPAGVNAIQLVNDLAAALPPAQGAALRKTLRGVAVQIVKVRTYHEQMLYDTAYFVVQAGKPVQVVLDNSADAMEHNFVLVAPGALAEVGQAGSALPPPNNPNDKAYVPDTKKVLEASHIAQGGETVTVSFTAPKKPGEYPYVCTYPGHWVRMYGVMVVVDDIDRYERNPKAPTDPQTRKPFASPKNAPMDAPAGAAADAGHAGHGGH